MKNSLPAIFSLCSLLFLSACSAIPPASPTAADTLEPSETPTNTPVPPTQTPTIPPPTPGFYPDAITVETAPQIEELERLGRGSIYGMSVSPNEEILAVSTTMGVWIYSLPAGELLHYFEDIPLNSWFDIPDIAWSPDGTMLAVGRKNNGVRVWDTKSWELLAERDITDGYIYDLPGIAWSPDGRYLAVGSGDQAVWVWDKTLDTWEDWSNYTGQQVGLTWTEDGQLLMIGGLGDGIFDVTTGEYLQPLDHWIDGFGKVSWSPDSSSVLIMFDLGGSVMDVQKNEFTFWAGIYPKSAWSPDSKYFATSFYEEEPVLWIYDTQTYELILDEALEQEPANALAWTPSGELLASGIIQGEKAIWNVHTGEILFSLENHRSYSDFIIWQQDISNFDNTPVNIHTLDESEAIYLLSVDSFLYRYDFSPEHSTLVGIDHEHRLHIWNPDSYRIIPTHSDDYIYTTQISPDGTLVAVGESQGDVKIFDTVDGALITVLAGSEYVGRLSWSPDMEKLFVDRHSEDDKLYHVADWTADTIPDTFLYGIYWLWNGDRLVFRHELGQYIFENTGTQETLIVIEDFSRDTLVVQSPDTTKFFVRRDIDRYEIWDIVNKEIVATIKFQGGFQKAVWSPDGTIIATSSGYGELFLWDAETGERLVDLVGHKDFIPQVTWSQDGSRLYTSSHDGTFRVWGIPR